ncbi:hypothetical protein [Panacagrimonas sp.]|uniref:hypothetical protein n=1 Tax=Panacagrimonas sp. TaxID=2480088 RepID=UPI003B522452
MKSFLESLKRSRSEYAAKIEATRDADNKRHYDAQLSRLDRLIHADNNLQAAIATRRSAQARATECRERLARMDKVLSDIAQELSTAKEQATAALNDSATAAIAARIEGRQYKRPAQPFETTLQALEAEHTEAQRRHAAATTETAEAAAEALNAQRVLYLARASVAELRFEAAKAEFLPAAEALRAAQSLATGSWSAAPLTLQLDRVSIRERADAIRVELDIGAADSQ